MIDKLKVFEKAWAEFVEWSKEPALKNMDFRNYCEYEDLTEKKAGAYIEKLCIEWLDSKGIGFTWDIVTNEHIKITYYTYCLHTNHYKDYTELKLYFGQDMTPVRSEATEAGIIRAFEIYNNQKEK